MELAVKMIDYNVYITIVSSPPSPPVRSMNPPVSFTTSPPVTDTEDDLESHKSTIVSTSTVGRRKQGPSNSELESSQYMGIDAVKKLRSHYTINRVSLRLHSNALYVKQ